MKNGKKLSLLIKPASSECNLACKYCFYLDETRHRQVASHGIMTYDVAKKIIDKALDYADECSFSFQGGEPTLAGIDFFKEFVGYAKKRKKPEQRVDFAIQTNGTLINDSWRKFLYSEKFLVGISLDGPPEIHDSFRTDRAGKDTFYRVFANAKKLLSAGVQVNILSVLTEESTVVIDKVYRFFKSNGFFYQQYIPCLDSLDGKQSFLSSYAYGQALKKLFDEWYRDFVTGTAVYIRDFENYISLLLGYQPEECARYGRCSMQNVIEANGDIYPCDFYVLDRFCMGNIADTDFSRLLNCSLCGEKFFSDASKRDDRCPSCRWYPLCRGGCRRDCYTESGCTENRYCQAYSEFFSYAIGRMEKIAAFLKSRSYH